MFFLDLVNYANGNSLVHPIQAGSMDPVPTTVFFPYPAGTDQNTSFKLFHFPEIKRSVDTFGTDWSNTTLEEVTLTKLQHGILFTVDSFSPFRLLWQKAQGGGGGGGSSRSELTILKTDASTGVTLAGAQFELKRADGSLVGTYTTGANGTFTLSGLSAGTYTLRETLSPSGYVLSGTPIEVKYPGGNQTVTIKNAKNSTPTDLDSVNHLAYIIGYQDGKVHPNNNITRAEVSTAFYRLLTPQRRDAIFTKENSFRDVTESLWYNKAVSSMAKGKYITGYQDGTFGGNQAITRAEFVAMAARFVAAVPHDNTPFTDIRSDHWAYEYVMTAVANGWLSGYPDGSFQPNRRITRAEAMTILNRMLNRRVEESGLITGYVRWPDNDPSAWYYHTVIEATNSHEYTRQTPSDSERWTAVNQNKVWFDKAYYEDSDQ